MKRCPVISPFTRKYPIFKSFISNLFQFWKLLCSFSWGIAEPLINLLGTIVRDGTCEIYDTVGPVRQNGHCEVNSGHKTEWTLLG